MQAHLVKRLQSLYSIIQSLLMAFDRLHVEIESKGEILIQYSPLTDPLVEQVNIFNSFRLLINHSIF